jgi:hypothetical protein
MESTMPAAFHIVLEKAIRGLKHERRFPAFTAVSHKLEDLAEKQGIGSHMHFFDSPEESDALLAELDVEPDGPGSYVWYSAAEGLTTLQTLRQHVEKSSSRFAKDGKLVEEIKEMERILEAAKDKKVRWCLTVDLDWDG